MIAILFAALLATAAARPDTPYGAQRSSNSEEVAILRDDRVAPSAAGEYSFDTETADGIVRSESGYGSGPDGAVESQGNVKFTHPDGEEFELSFVANAEGGYQPQSDSLPVAPAFPFELPQFVLDQIEKAAREDAAKSNERPSYQ